MSGPAPATADPRPAVPDGVAPADLAAYCLMLGDDALVASHRLAHWCSRAPDLELDVALANVALDLLDLVRELDRRHGHPTDPAVLRQAAAYAEQLAEPDLVVPDLVGLADALLAPGTGP